jgi:hypothetical protein
MALGVLRRLPEPPRKSSKIQCDILTRQVSVVVVEDLEGEHGLYRRGAGSLGHVPPSAWRRPPLEATGEKER